MSTKSYSEKKKLKEYSCVWAAHIGTAAIVSYTPRNPRRSYFFEGVSLAFGFSKEPVKHIHISETGAFQAVIDGCSIRIPSFEVGKSDLEALSADFNVVSKDFIAALEVVRQHGEK